MWLCAGTTFARGARAHKVNILTTLVARAHTGSFISLPPLGAHNEYHDEHMRVYRKLVFRSTRCHERGTGERTSAQWGDKKP